MKKSISIIAGLMLAISMCGTAFAKKHNNNGNPPPNSQAGGLPALAAKVNALSQAVTNLQSAVATLNSEVSTLQSDVNSLNNSVSDLQGQNNWVVVSIGTSSPTIARQSTNLNGAATVASSSAGVYTVTFPMDVSGCAYSATLDSTGATPVVGFATVASDSTSKDAVDVQTFDASSGTPAAANSGFDLYVSCN